MFGLKTYKIFVVFRVLVEWTVYIIGLFNINSMISRKNVQIKRIAFQVYALHLAQFYQPIVAGLQKKYSDKIEITFVILSHPHFSFKATRDLREYIQNVLLIPRENIKPFWKVIWEEYDMMVFVDLYAKFPLRKTRTWFMNHGAVINERHLKNALFRKSVFDFDRAFFTGLYDIELLKPFFNRQNKEINFQATGLPFLDRLIDPPISKSVYFENLSLDETKKTVLFTPHWKGSDDKQASSINTYFDQVILLLQKTDYNIILKLHACSFNIAMANGIDWKKKIQGLKGVAVDYDFDDIPALKYSDLILSDFSSTRALNFMLLDKPVVMILHSLSTFTSESLNIIRKGAIVLERIETLNETLEYAFTHPELLKDERQEVTSHFIINFGKATGVVVDRIGNELDLQPQV